MTKIQTSIRIDVETLDTLRQIQTKFKFRSVAQTIEFLAHSYNGALIKIDLEKLKQAASADT